MHSKLMKTIFYIPAILFAVLLGLLLASSETVTTSPVIMMWLVLFFITGILLSKGLFWGSILGVLPGIHMIYMGTQDTGQIISETPIGMTIIVFYIFCGYVVYRNNKKVKRS